jgi:hypothetical protein
MLQLLTRTAAHHYQCISATAVHTAAAHLQDVTRVSVLHASFMDYLLQLANERYQVLAQWPDFTTLVRPVH